MSGTADSSSRRDIDVSSMHDPRLYPGARDAMDDFDDDEEEEEEEPQQQKEEEWDGVTTKGPVVALLIGMAGSGKSTLFHRLYYDAVEDPAKQRRRCYFINLDPATLETPIDAHIDVRDTVDYKGVMREYSLGPNGAIVTCLNLFATQFHEVMAILERRAAEFDYVVVDTPGQIEAFTWSASGQLFAETLASTFATTVLYVVDTPRSRAPATFMSNMVYACSILHKYRLPFIAAFNKADVADPAEDCFKWMDDFEEFHHALDDAENRGESYVTSLHRSMSLVLDEFYRCLDRVAVSAADGRGIDEVWDKLSASRRSYDTSYGNEVRALIKERRAEKEEKVTQNLKKLQIDSEGPAHYDPSLAARMKTGGNRVPTIPEDDEGASSSLPPGQLKGQPNPLPTPNATPGRSVATRYSREGAPAIRSTKPVLSNDSSS